MQALKGGESAADYRARQDEIGRMQENKLKEDDLSLQKYLQGSKTANGRDGHTRGRIESDTGNKSVNTDSYA
jgi:hypothetical protein